MGSVHQNNLVAISIQDLNKLFGIVLLPKLLIARVIIILARKYMKLDNKFPPLIQSRNRVYV